MLECQRNGESSFAVSASTCIHKGEGGGRSRTEGGGGKATEGRRETGRWGWMGRKGYKEGRGRRTGERERARVCLLSAPLPLSAVLIPAIFN